MSNEKVKDMLAHSGILGMKWGVRRKNPSGVSTVSSDHGKTKAIKGKKVKELSNEELRTAINRVRLEKEYKEVTAKQKSAGRKAVEEALINAGKATLQTYAQKAMTKGVEKVLGEAAKQQAANAAKKTTAEVATKAATKIAEKIIYSTTNKIATPEKVW